MIPARTRAQRYSAAAKRGARVRKLLDKQVPVRVVRRRRRRAPASIVPPI